MSDLNTSPTITLKAAELRAGMTLMESHRRLIIDRVRVDPSCVTVTTTIGDLPIDSAEEVDVLAVNGRPHLASISVSHF